ncbi:hypothetical protein PIROE2DRAFT_8606, partial [Piromyces sp. E2]
NETPNPTKKYATQVESPFTHLGLELVTERNNQYILVIVEYYQRALKTAKNSITKYFNFKLLYGCKDLQPFELATTLSTSNVLGTKDEQLIEKFINHHKWVLNACKDLKKNNQY